MNGAMYFDIIEKLISSAKQVNLGRRRMIQQDDNPEHTAKIAKEGFGWRNQALDLNPIETL